MLLIPHPALILSDLTFTEEANPKMLTEPTATINSGYTSIMGAKIRLFKSFQKRQYKFMKPLYSVSNIKDFVQYNYYAFDISYIYGELVFGEDELYKLSKLREDANAPSTPHADP